MNNNYWLNKKDEFWSFQVPKWNVNLDVKLENEPQLKSEGINGYFEPLKIKIGDAFSDINKIPNTFWNWMASIYEFLGESDSIKTPSTEVKTFAYLKKDKQMYSLKGAWPSEINLGYLDFSSSENYEIEISLQFDAISLHLDEK